jgi:serine/threonine protein kinase
MNIKIADFGFSNYFDLVNPLKTFCGSAQYAAPEIFFGTSYFGPEIDIWSLGVILFVLVSGYFPFDSDNLISIKHSIGSGVCEPLPCFVSTDCKHLIKGMLNVDPIKRLTLTHIYSHQWIKQFQPHQFKFNNNNTSNHSLITKNRSLIIKRTNNNDFEAINDDKSLYSLPSNYSKTNSMSEITSGIGSDRTTSNLTFDDFNSNDKTNYHLNDNKKNYLTVPSTVINENDNINLIKVDKKTSNNSSSNSKLNNIFNSTSSFFRINRSSNNNDGSTNTINNTTKQDLPSISHLIGSINLHLQFDINN